MRGPAEQAAAIAAGQPSRLGAAFSLHITELVLAIQSAGTESGPIRLSTRF